MGPYNLHFHNDIIQQTYYQNQLITEYARKNLAKRALCDLP